MPRLVWGKSSGYSAYDPIMDKVYISKRAIEKGRAPATLAHELAHRREGTFAMMVEEPEKAFWRELATWEAAIERGLPLEELDEDIIKDSLGSFLDDVKDFYGEDSREYRECREGYEKFKRRFL